jgi:hypothetical protein
MKKQKVISDLERAKQQIENMMAKSRGEKTNICDSVIIENADLYISTWVLRYIDNALEELKR